MMDTNNNPGMMREPTTVLSNRPATLGMTVTPVADIYETADAFVIRLDMPGASRETISVMAEPGYLAAKGAVAPYHAETGTLLLAEIPRRSYLREFHLGQGASHEKVEASFENGVLTISVPKTEEMKSKTIRIK